MASDFLAGMLGGIADVMVGFPLDTIKVRMQMDAARAASIHHREFKSPLDCAMKIVKQESTLGLFKGMMSPMLGEMMNNCVLFGVYGLLRPFQQWCDHSWSSIAISGAIAGTAMTTVVSPVELIKLKLQINRDRFSQRPEGFTRCVARVIREGGLRGIYHGYSSTLLREIPFNAVYFVTYEASRRFFKKQRLERGESGELSKMELLISGGNAGFAAWLVTYPADVIKSSVQTSETPLRIADFARSAYKKNGLGVFYHGLGIALLRAWPVNAAAFLTYEMTMKALTGNTTEWKD